MHYQTIFRHFLSWIIFASRWLQAPLYIGLIVAQSLYVYQFLIDLYHLTAKIGNFSEEQVMLVVLGLIDVVMISNLLVMIIIGGYETFVSRLQVDGHPDVPDWLSHVNASTMKIKLALALIGISSIHMLKSFINVDHLTDRALIAQVVIHLTFLVSAIAMAYTNKIAHIK